jgi:hypothetical protein
MSQDRSAEASSGGATTLVLVVPAPSSPDTPANIASALERAVEALRSGAGPMRGSVGAAFGGEAALMRQVEAEVYRDD